MKTLRLNVLSCQCCVGGKGCLASTQYSQGRRDIREKQEKFKNKKQDEKGSSDNTNSYKNRK
jgi:hypothetical protein